MGTQKRYRDNKERNLIIIERHQSDNVELPTYKTFYASIKIPGAKKTKLKKVGSSYENKSIAIMRDRVLSEIKDSLENGTSEIVIDKFFYDFYKPSLIHNGRKTIKDIEDNYVNNIQSEFGHLKMRKLKSDIIYKWFMTISERSEGTANHCLTIIKAMYNLAIKINQAKNNPADKISKNHIAKRKRYFTDDETALFHNGLKTIADASPYGSAFIYLAYLTGARKGELAKATWDDLQGNKIVLKEHKTDDKTDEPRVIYLSNEALDVINNIPRTNKTILKIKCPDRQWKKLMKITGIKDFRFHDLRHNFGTQAMNNGIGMIRVGTLMGHTSVKAMEIYQVAKPETLQSDIKQIGGFLAN